MPASTKQVRLSNGQFELAVSPVSGRIVRYGRVGGPNALWVNPDATDNPSPFPGWVNWGGDKVWIWPEQDWTTWLGMNAPPGDPPPGEYDVETNGQLLQMISPPIPEYGVRIVRELALAESGSKLTQVNRLEQVMPGRQSLPIGVWTVAQVPAPRFVLARLLPGASPSYQSFAGGDWLDVQRNGAVAILTRQSNPWAKLGLEADALAVPVGDLLFSARTLEVQGDFEPCRRAQVFSDPDDSPFRRPELPPYVEMEFTSPVRRLQSGESTTLKLEWELRALPSPSASATEAMVEFLK